MTCGCVGTRAGDIEISEQKISPPSSCIAFVSSPPLNRSTTLIPMPASVGLCAVRRVGLGVGRLAPLARPGLAAFNCRAPSLPPRCLNLNRAFSVSSFLRSAPSPAPPTPSTPPPPPEKEKKEETELHESPYTLPNALTVARIIACPFLGWAIVKGDFAAATGILAASGFTDWLDGYLARKWNQKSVLGSIIDPMADKMLMTTLVVALTYDGLLPRELPSVISDSCYCREIADLSPSRWSYFRSRPGSVPLGLLPPVQVPSPAQDLGAILGPVDA